MKITEMENEIDQIYYLRICCKPFREKSDALLREYLEKWKEVDAGAMWPNVSWAN